MDETRLDLRAADQERLRQWEQAVQENRRALARTLETGVALYPTIGRRGTIYGTRRVLPDEAIDAPEDRDEEIKMYGGGRQNPAVERPSYQQALDKAIYHADKASETADAHSETRRDKSEAHSAASEAWSRIAELLHREEREARERVSANRPVERV